MGGMGGGRRPMRPAPYDRSDRFNGPRGGAGGGGGAGYDDFPAPRDRFASSGSGGGRYGRGVYLYCVCRHLVSLSKLFKIRLELTSQY